jgi:ubiquinone/menaquinone biosynthesis C-methylase UbiE
MPVPSAVSKHYSRGGLIDAMRAGISALGKTTNSVTVDDLAPADEFHIGGRKATEELLHRLKLSPESHVLDIGCGIGGAARFAADRYQSRVTGIDLTEDYIKTAQALCRWVKLEQRISLQACSALSLPFADRAFDAAYMLHVGMNIEDKEELCTEVARVLRPGSLFGIYDIMQTGPGELTYPLPWAASAEMSALAAPRRYKAALQAAGLAVIHERNRSEFALTFFGELRARMAAAGGPPPLGLHLLMGTTAPQKIDNMIEGISTGRIAPVEMVARKAQP